MRNIYAIISSNSILKTLLLSTFCLLFSFCKFAHSADIPKNFSGGKGNAQEPYLISNEQELFELSRRILSDDMDGGRKYRHASYRQVADINLTSILTWVPIGDVFYYPTGKRVDRSFAGVYDGMGYAISNMAFRISEIQENKMIQRQQIQIGLFGVVNGDGVKNGIVKNIRLVNSTLDIDSSTSQKFRGTVGSIVGTLANGKIENCKTMEGKFRVTLNGEVSPNDLVVWNVGGIAGEIMNGTIQNCSNNVEMEVESAKERKGYTLHAGGITGSFSRGLLRDCGNSADITLRSSSSVSVVGGIAANVNLDGEILDCVNEGEIKYDGNAGSLIGGIAGTLDGKIRRSANMGPVTLSSTARGSEMGGIVGRIAFGMTVLDESWNSGEININININYNHEQTYVTKTRKSSYLPKVEPALRFQIGGLVGNMYGGNVSNSYNKGNINGKITVNGLPLPSFIFIGGTVGHLNIDEFSSRIRLANLYNVGLIDIVTLTNTKFWQGGIIGGLTVLSRKKFNDAEVSLCYWLVDANTLSGIGNYSGSRLTKSIEKLPKEDFVKRESFKNWDFEKTWTLGTSYPELINRP
jgi:hypothetical protein